MELTQEVARQIEEMKRERGSGYKPRTTHLDENGNPEFTNRLFLESSPYLLQHAHNPVNWYPWGDEAFETARKKGIPLLLSVGYATCHWCHVMEEESFEDLEIARCINDNYIPVKVDREERPDVDAVYMSAVQAITGHGGWPMTVWLTPDKKPFYAGTYFPARDGDRGISVGFLTILKRLRSMWDNSRDLIQNTSTQLTSAVQQMLAPEKGERVDLKPVVQNAAEQLKAKYDKVNGGAAGAPKFPSSMPVSILLRRHRRTKDETLLEMASHTLLKMASGGIYDHAGGGFHRYATDEKWRVPHFEKMLYDNALLAAAYVEGFQVTGREMFKRVAEETLLYIQRDMTSPGGGFYSATDADSLNHEGESEEGYFFTWTPEELTALLGEKDGSIVGRFFDVTDSPNFENRSILNIKQNADLAARELNIPEKALWDTIKAAKPKLYKERRNRSAPLRDEKIITAWNGLMISAFARAGLALAVPEYIETGGKAARFVLNHLCSGTRLFRSYKDGKALQKGFLEDYAFFIAALLDLFEADPDPRWIETAVELEKTMSELFEDRENGGFFMTGADHEKMIAREKPGFDGAVPSGNSVSAMNLLRLSLFTTNDTYRQRAAETLAAFSPTLRTHPAALSEMVKAVDFILDRPKEIVIVVPENREKYSAPFLKELGQIYVPNRILVRLQEGKHAERLAKTLPLAKDKTSRDGKATAYICEQGRCGLPLVSANQFKEKLKHL